MTQLHIAWIQDVQTNEVSLYTTDNSYGHSVSKYDDFEYCTQDYALKIQRPTVQEV